MAEWFAPKRYGWGGGRPVTWQGWVVTLVYLAIVVGATQLLNRSPWAGGSIIVTATAMFIVVLAKTTRGGFRWRWGDKE
jgi:hypothetical protein